MAVYEPVHLAHYPYAAKTGLQALCFEVERRLRQLHQRLLGVISDSQICDQVQQVIDNPYPVKNITPLQALLLFQISNGLTRSDELRAQCVIGAENMLLDLRQLADAGLLIIHKTSHQLPHGVVLTAGGAAFAERIRQLCDRSQVCPQPTSLTAHNVASGNVHASAQLARLNASLQRLAPYLVP